MFQRITSCPPTTSFALPPFALDSACKLKHYQTEEIMFTWSLEVTSFVAYIWWRLKVFRSVCLHNDSLALSPDICTSRFGLPLPYKAPFLSPWIQLQSPSLLLRVQLQSRDPCALHFTSKPNGVAGFYSQLIQAIRLSRTEFCASMAMNVSKLAINHGFLKWALFQGIQSSWHWESMYMASSKYAHTWI